MSKYFLKIFPNSGTNPWIACINSIVSQIIATSGVSYSIDKNNNYQFPKESIETIINKKILINKNFTFTFITEYELQNHTTMFANKKTTPICEEDITKNTNEIIEKPQLSYQQIIEKLSNMPTSCFTVGEIIDVTINKLSYPNYHISTERLKEILKNAEKV